MAFYLAVGLRFGFDWALVAESVGPLPLRALAFTASLVVGLLSMGLYRPRQRPTRSETAVRVILGVTVGGFFGIVLFYLVPPVSFGRGALGLALMIGALLVFGVRLWMLRVLDFNPSSAACWWWGRGGSRQDSPAPAPLGPAPVRRRGLHCA